MWRLPPAGRTARRRANGREIGGRGGAVDAGGGGSEAVWAVCEAAAAGSLAAPPLPFVGSDDRCLPSDRYPVTAVNAAQKTAGGHCWRRAALRRPGLGRG